MDDDYYYDDEGYDDYYDNGADEVADVDPLEAKYIDGKSYMQNNVEESLRCLREVLDEDAAHGRWTFKALKMLSRASRMAKQYDQMAQYYARVARFSHPDIDTAAIAKAMLKFSEESRRVPGQWREQTLLITLEVALADTEHYRAVLVPTLLQRATLYLEETKYAEALADLQTALLHCNELETAAAAAAAPLHATAVYQIRALQLEAYRRLRRFAELRRTYYAIGRVQAALPPLRMVGGVMESAGHLFLHDSDWAAAHRAFSAALRCYTESGDAQQHAVVKFVVLATMLAELPADLFAQDDALIDHANVRPVRALWTAFAASDVAGFFSVLDDPNNAACLLQDDEFSPYVEAVVHRLRVNYLKGYTCSFATVSLADLAQRLRMEEGPCKALCTSAILHGVLDGQVEDERGMLRLRPSRAARVSAARRDAEATRDFAVLTNALCCQSLRY